MLIGTGQKEIIKEGGKKRKRKKNKNKRIFFSSIAKITIPTPSTEYEENYEGWMVACELVTSIIFT